MSCAEHVAIKQELRARGMLCGIYAIQHEGSGKAYVGSSQDIPKRIAEHLQRLRNNQHHSAVLQNHWNKYGADAFGVLFLEHCIPEELLNVEQIFIDCMGKLNGSPFAVTGKRTAERKRNANS